jgi:PAS domain S-box-containing protein
MPRRLITLAAVIVGLHLIEVMTLGINPPGPLLAELLESFAAAVAVWMCFGAYRRARGVSRPFWLLVGLAVGSQVVTDLTWAYLEGWHHTLPTTLTVVQLLPSIRALLLVLVLFLDPADDSPRLGLGSLVDLVQIVIVFFFLYLLVEYVPGEFSATIQREVQIAVLQRMVLIVLAVVQFAQVRKLPVRPLYGGFLLYLTWYLLGEGPAIYLTATRNIPSGTLLDLAYTLPLLGVGLWAASWTQAEARPESAARPKTIGQLMLANATFALAPLIVLLQVTQLGPEFQMLRYSLLGVSILCFATRLGLSEYRQSQHLESLRRHKLTLESAREDLSVQKAFLEQLIESAPEAIAIVGPDMVVQRINREFTRLFGYLPGEACGRDLDTLIVPADKKDEGMRVNRDVDLGQTASLETVRQSKDGTQIEVSILTTPVKLTAGRTAMFWIYRDIRERKRVENQLRQAQKMEAVGRLAGGVAHDFNNLLTVINGYGDLLLHSLQKSDPVRSKVEQMRRAGERAAELTQQLLAFSRKQIVQPKALDLNSLVADSEKMFSRLIGEDIQLTTILSPSLGQILADPGQIHQVLMNLLVNARDAMPNGGKMIIETANVELDAGFAARHAQVQAPAGPYVLLAISDTGSGMDEQTRQHIFEPFYTTKGVGGGTGLGLSTVYGIVKQGGGWIWVYSELGQGTTFKIYLPRIDVPRAGDASEFAATELNGSETLLLVEDQDDVRQLASAVLASRGYRILEAANGDDAVVLSERYQDPIHLMVTDVVLPGMNGKQVAEKLQALRPGMKVLYTSGYPEAVIAQRGVLDGNVAYISKPYTPDGLAAKVREVLQADSPARRS